MHSLSQNGIRSSSPFCCNSIAIALCAGMLITCFTSHALAQINKAASSADTLGAITQITAVINDHDAPNDIHRKMNFLVRFMLADSASFIDDKTEYQMRLKSLNTEFPEFQSELQKIMTDDNYRDEVIENLQNTSTKFYLRDATYRNAIDKNMSEIYLSLEKLKAQQGNSGQPETRFDALIMNYETQVEMTKSSIATKHMRLYTLAERLSFLYEAQTAERKAVQASPKTSASDPQIKVQAAAPQKPNALGQITALIDFDDPHSINRKMLFINEYRWVQDEILSNNTSAYQAKLSALKKKFPEFESEILRMSKEFQYKKTVLSEFNNAAFARYTTDPNFQKAVDGFVNEARKKFNEVEKDLAKTKTVKSSFDIVISDTREPILDFIRNIDKETAFGAYDFIHNVNQFMILVNRRNQEISAKLRAEQEAEFAPDFTPFDFNDEEYE